MTQMQTPPAPPAGNPAAPPPEPFKMPEKFAGKTAEQIAQSYVELERSRTATPAADPAAPPTLKIEPAAAPAMFKSVDDVLARAGLKADDVAKQFSEAGKLTPEQYQAFAKQGFGEEVVDGFMRGEQARGQSVKEKNDALRAEVFTLAGGEEQFGNMQAWAASNCTKAELAKYNEMVEGKAATPDSIRMAGQWLVSRYQSANGGASAPAARTSPTAPGGVTPFASKADVTAAMADPRYRPTINNVRNPRYDPAYERHVDARLAIS